VVLYPSDTVYGLLCDAADPDAVRRLGELKGYARRRPFIVLAGDLGEAVRIARLGEAAISVARRLWPGPLTLVGPAASEAPAHLLSDAGEIAVRCPADPISKMLLELYGAPLVSTSANLAGQPHPASVEEVPSVIRTGCALLLDGGPVAGGRKPSTVARIGPDGPEVLREGALPAGELQGG
jgi:L-threonylcarbamoyladenylate synthase